MTEPDTELIARAVASNDRAAFSELVLRHQSSVRNFLRHLLRGDAAQADDLAQDTFVPAYRGISRDRGERVSALGCSESRTTTTETPAAGRSSAGRGESPGASRTGRAANPTPAERTCGPTWRRPWGN